MNYLDDAVKTPSRVIKIVNHTARLKVKYYWYESGTSSAIVNSLANYPVELFEAEKEDIFLEEKYVNQGCSIEVYNEIPILQLFHGGYFTIDEYKEYADPATSELVCGYKLKLPNEEVKAAFRNDLLEHKMKIYSKGISDYLAQGRYEDFYIALQDLFRDYQSINPNEDFYHCHVYHYIDYCKKPGELCETEQFVKKRREGVKGKRPDIIYLQQEILYIIELKHSPGSVLELKGTAEERKYLMEATKNSSVIWQNFKMSKPENIVYRSIDIAFNNTNIYQMAVYELLPDLKNTKEIYRKFQKQSLIHLLILHFTCSVLYDILQISFFSHN
eukprot:TRINITY_DN792_c0_g1_i1.p1 TRINITY_DN792_c0_g1~~TRINITY_DN792_c0_g1_i1.p1  ORF type:complete len:330 (+),score=33.36 TRINITY_DN792_c0_g1_i1:1949-2938(+)